MLADSSSGAAETLASCLQNQLTQFSLSHARSTDEHAFLIKPLGELALTAAILRRQKLLPNWCDRMLNFAWSELDAGNVLLRLLAARPDLIVCATLYASFRECGFENGRLDALIRHFSETAFCNAIEFPTWRRLDVLYGLHALGFAAIPPRAEEGTWLHARPEPWLITDDVAYAVTHEVFYLTDFGRANDALDQRTYDYLVCWLPAWLAIYEARSNWDLFAEFLMTSSCVRQSRQSDLQTLIGAIDSDGFLPGPAGSASSVISTIEEPHRKTFLRNYHTTLVGLMALALNCEEGRGVR